MPDHIAQSQVNQTAWAACDTFRGVVDAGQYKDYILVMLFLKYISDLWNDHVAAYRQRFGGDEARIRRRLERERFVLPVGASFYDLYEQRNEANIGERINIALEAIEDANRAKLDGVFRNIGFNSEANLGRTKDRNRRLRNLLEDFAKPALDLRRPSYRDIIGECYIYLISRFASDAGKKAGEFYTPAAVSRLLAKLAAPKPGDTICDPACGSGSLLVRAAEEVGSGNYALYGQEVNGATWALARMNMFLHAKDAARIEWCDTLNSPTLVEADGLMTFDVVVANPPFSLDKWGAENAAADRYERFWRGVPPKSKGDYGFITHMIEIAKRQSGARRRHRAARRAVPGRRQRPHPAGVDRRKPARYRRRPAGQPVHHHRHSGCRPGLRPLARGRRRRRSPQGRAVHRRQQGVHARQDAERHGRSAYRQGPGHLPPTRRDRQILPSGEPGRNR